MEPKKDLMDLRNSERILVMAADSYRKAQKMHLDMLEGLESSANADTDPRAVKTRNALARAQEYFDTVVARDLRINTDSPSKESVMVQIMEKESPAKRQEFLARREFAVEMASQVFGSAGRQR